MEYNLNLNLIRNEHKLTQDEVAKTLGITRTVYTKYENGYELIPIKYLINFANYFDVSIDFLLGLNHSNKKLQYNQNIDFKLIGSKLKDWRKENKLTQEKLAKVLNTNKSVICNYEKGRYLIATPFLYQICHQYHVSADYLLGRIDEPKYLKEN